MHHLQQRIHIFIESCFRLSENRNNCSLLIKTFFFPLDHLWSLNVRGESIITTRRGIEHCFKICSTVILLKLLNTRKGVVRFNSFRIRVSLKYFSLPHFDVVNTHTKKTTATLIERRHAHETHKTYTC